MLHGSQLKLVVVRHPHKRAPAENPFKAGPKPEPRINTKQELKLIYEQKHNLDIYVCVFFFSLNFMCCSYKFLSPSVILNVISQLPFYFLLLRWKQASSKSFKSWKSLGGPRLNGAF